MLTKKEEKLVRSLAVRKQRRLTGLFAAEGTKLVQDLAASGLALQYIFHLPQAEPFSSWSGAKEVSVEEMKQLSFLETPSPVLAVFEQPQVEKDQFAKASTVLLLDRVQDPGNVGTLLRSALWYGVECIGLVQGTADPFAPKVVQASMSAHAHVKLWSQTAEEWVLWAATNDFELVVAHMEGTPARALRWPERTLLVLGNEGQGVDPFFHERAHHKATLPGHPEKMESLNVAISGATLLYEHAVSRGL